MPLFQKRVSLVIVAVSFLNYSAEAIHGECCTKYFNEVTSKNFPFMLLIISLDFSVYSL
jgi:hypothetical protein